MGLRAQPFGGSGSIDIVLAIDDQFYQAFVDVASYGGGWLHVSLEVPSFSLYINGLRVELVDVEPLRTHWTPLPFLGASLFLGGTYDDGMPSDFYRGLLSEVHLQRGEVHQGNFIPLRPSLSAQNTLGLWRLDEGRGTTIFDSGFDFRVGTVNGEANWYPCIDEE